MKNLLILGVLWIGLIIQSTLFQIPPINVVQPNLVLVALMVVALTRGNRAALVLGIVIGLIQDVNYAPFMGLNAFSYGVIGYFAASAFAQFLHRNVTLTFLVTIVCTFIFEWMTYGMTRLFDVTAYSWHSVLSFSFQQMLTNGITLLIFYPPLTRLFSNRVFIKYRQSGLD